MKTTRTLGLLLAFATILIFSCKKTDLAKTDTTEEITGASRIVLVSGMTTIKNPDCSSTCIDPSGPYVESSGSKTQTWGNPANPKNWKTVSHTVYNTATTLVVKVTFAHSGGNSSNTVSVTAFGSTQSVSTLASGATATFTFDLPIDWSACDNVPFSIHQEGQNSPMNLSCLYILYGICANRGCETSFTGKANACGTAREAVYTFTYKDELNGFKIQGGLTNFTGADAEVIVTGGRYAKAKKKPVIYMRNKNAENSTTVSGISDHQIIYSDINDLKELLKGILSNVIAFQNRDAE